MDVVPPLTADRISEAAPFSIEPAMLTASTVAEPSSGEAAWSSGSTYALGDRAIVGAPSATVTISVGNPGTVSWTGHGLPNGTPVILTTTGALPGGLNAGQVYFVTNRAANTFQLALEPEGLPIQTVSPQSGTHTATGHVHLLFESAAASNTNNPPAIDNGSKWFVVGPTNAWSMFHMLRNTPTVAASPLVVTVTPGERVDAAGLDGVVADFAMIEVIRGGVTVASVSQQMLWRPTTSWKTYFFGKFRQRSAISATELPSYIDAQIRFTLTRGAGDVRCAYAVVGQGVYIGDLLFNGSNDQLNFSVIDRKETGETQLLRRRSVPRLSGQLRASKLNVDALIEARDRLNAVPAMWLGLSDPGDGYYRAFAVTGLHKRWSINADHPDVVLQQLEVEGV